MKKKVKYKIGASILSADFANLGHSCRLAEEALVDYIHIDIMDGKFVDGITWGPQTIESLKSYTNLPLDVHLLIKNPELFLDKYISVKPNSISVHPESTIFSRKILNKIKENNIKAGVALKLDTPINQIENIIDCADYVLLLTSEEGFGGNKFSKIGETKIISLFKLMKEKNIRIPIQIDGGVNKDNIGKISSLGIEYFVVGSSIFNSNDIFDNVNNLRIS